MCLCWQLSNTFAQDGVKIKFNNRGSIKGNDKQGKRDTKAKLVVAVPYGLLILIALRTFLKRFIFQ